MDSSNESFTISSKQTLIENQPPPSAASKPTAKRSYRKTITVALLILVTIIAISITLFYVCKKDKEPLNRYLSSSSKYYCHVTRYPDLCYESMASVVVNSTSSLIKDNPTHIFTSSIQASINEAQKASLVLNRTASFLSSETSSNCGKWMQSSLNLLVKSLDVLGNVSDTDSLTFYEMNNVRTNMWASASHAMKCVSALESDGYGNNDTTTGEVKRGVEEVRSGVERARKCVVNSVVLWRNREMILEEFYNPYVVESARDDYYYYYYYYSYYYYYFDYPFLVGMYSLMYLFLALLYYLFWHSK